ncbi:MAG: energy transducer TonB [Chloroherpetonaceae bacterium]|nr:energy transducer TonB [Chloroherpetonaceae bacterium]
MENTPEMMQQEIASKPVAPADMKHWFVKPDYLETEKFRRLSYGGLVIRHEIHTYMGRALFFTISAIVASFITFYAYHFVKDLLAEGDEDAMQVRQRVITSVNELAPPPPMNQDQPPPPPKPMIKPPAAPDVGQIKKVKDEEAPRQKTLATQEVVKKAIEKNAFGEGDTTGLSDPNVVAYVPVQEPVQLDDADPEDFVAVEKEPEFVDRPAIAYPEVAKRAGMEGLVVVRVLIEKDGRPKKAQIMKNPGTDIFDQAAIDNVMKATYTPAIQNGKAVKVWMTVPIRFKLNQR